MQAKSFLGEMRETVQHFYATTIRGEVSDANVRGYLRAASQIEEVWQQIDEKLAGLIAVSSQFSGERKTAHVVEPVLF